MGNVVDENYVRLRGTLQGSGDYYLKLRVAPYVATLGYDTEPL